LSELDHRPRPRIRSGARERPRRCAHQ
jgi:hypothetical protein